MNAATANQISITGYLSTIGASPERSDSRNCWYLSPIHDEKTPSFKVNQTNNIWYDFGTGTGGRLVDLVCQLYRVGVKEALTIISGTETTARYFSFDQRKENTPDESTIEIKKIQTLQNRALIQYFEFRGIPLDIARRYTDEIYYNTYKGQTRSFFAIAFKNDKGGYELRNNVKTKNFRGGFKGSTSPKAITTINGNNKRINIFEGFIDFLSALVFFGIQQPANKTIILNSLSHLRKLYEIIPSYAQVNLYLDNDQAGRKAASEFILKYPGTINQAIEIYPEFKDFNELICNNLQP